MNPKRFILAIDQGTTSSRAVLVDVAGAIVGVAQREFTQHFPQPGWVEHDPREILASVQSSMVDVLARAHVDPAQLAAIGITNQRETTVLWDRRSGEPIHRAIVWQSRQSASICARWESEGLEPLVRERTGLVLDAYFSASKIRWLLDTVPGARERAARGELLFGTIDTWLLWNLSGQRVHATDASNAARTLLYDIHARRWCPELLRAFDIPAAMLPEVRSCSEVYAHTDANGVLGRRVPIAGIAGDQQAALFGQACFAPGMAKVTYGTGCFLLMHTGKQAVRSQHGLLGTIAWDLGGEVEYALEGSVFVAGSALQWLRDGLRLIESARESQACAESAGGTDGVYFVPAFVGLGAPYWRSDARGAMFGLTRGTSRDQFVRAVLESLAYQTRDVLDAMQADAGARLTTLRADGGAIANDFLAQFQADLLDTPLERPRINEASVLGAAYLAGLAVGIWASRAEIARCWQLERRFVPQMDATRRDRLYAGWKRAVDAALAFGVAADDRDLRK
ncbi:MAG: glycerol kinase GlpK [Chiayiivirga sp.]|uniref:glycerol kinase GlpK n=1 Tax=Chiayiivirga sp. TaxID=2041042 RepID=UPI0025C07099|nr:glycerol kinase GlpK [Chiayiivirga sp.]MCI1710237.1 glycerol kinase GlpK [Chiayiivirga sp.]MCI1728969.1 glycerol kinase GlpK [Chiayiivirga sp.]